MKLNTAPALVLILHQLQTETNETVLLQNKIKSKIYIDPDPSTANQINLRAEDYEVQEKNEIRTD